MNLKQTYFKSIVKEVAEIKMVAAIFWISTFALLTAAGSKIEILTHPVPFTLQTFFVLLAGALLGKKGGALSMGLYVLSGAAGLPVFSGISSGLAKLIGPTGGYLLSFPVAAFVVGYLVGIRKDYWWILAASAIGSLIIFTFGVVHLNIMFIHNWQRSLQAGFLIFSVWDGVKILAVSSIAYYYYKNIEKS
jgi:biotin transport system substrate-specific component